MWGWKRLLQQLSHAVGHSTVSLKIWTQHKGGFFYSLMSQGLNSDRVQTHKFCGIHFLPFLNAGRTQSVDIRHRRPVQCSTWRTLEISMCCSAGEVCAASALRWLGGGPAGECSETMLLLIVSPRLMEFVCIRVNSNFV